LGHGERLRALARRFFVALGFDRDDAEIMAREVCGLAAELIAMAAELIATRRAPSTA
jgi:hypothetical protein